MVTSADERRFFHVLIRAVFAVTAVATLIAMFGSLAWQAELFTHFRPYYLLIQASLMLVFMHSGRRALCVATLLLAVPNAWIVGPYLVPTIGGGSAAEAAAHGIDIVALNVNYRNRDVARVAAYLRERDPDIAVIAEFTPAWRDGLATLRDAYPYHIGVARTDQWGLGVYSRLPFADAELIDLAATDTVHARFVISAGTSPLEVFAVHLFSPTSARRAHGRNRQLDDLARRVGNSTHARLVIGDMNLTPFSPVFRRFIRATGLRDARRADGFHFTWPVSVWPVWIPIDHAFADAARLMTRVRTGPELGSDHYPLEVRVSPVLHGAR